MARIVADRTDRRWQAGSRHLATNLSSRMRCAWTPPHRHGDGPRRLRAFPALDWRQAIISLSRSLACLLLGDTAIDVLGSVAEPHVAIVVGHSASAFGYSHVAVDDRRLGGHTDRRTGIRNSLGPCQIRSR